MLLTSIFHEWNMLVFPGNLPHLCAKPALSYGPLAPPRFPREDFLTTYNP